MVVGVDEAGQDDMRTGIEDFAGNGRLPARCNALQPSITTPRTASAAGMANFM